MAEMRGANQNNKMANWAQEAKSKARELRSSAHSVARNLFRSGDLRSYLDLVCRMNYYDAYNLLLLLQQYPKATCLAGFRLWQKFLPNPSAPVLKPEWRGKGIDLIAPYTEMYGNGQSGLTWFAVKQFDISQTYVEGYTLPPSPYLPDDRHEELLISSVSDVIAIKYHRSVIHISSSSELRSAGLPGQMNESTLLVRDDIKASLRLTFLCQCLCQLAMSESQQFTPIQRELANQCVLHCLFQTWQLTPARPLRQNAATLGSFPPEHQVPFLSLIQRTVRLLDEDISYLYTQARRGPEPYAAIPLESEKGALS